MKYFSFVYTQYYFKTNQDEILIIQNKTIHFVSNIAT